ncbi:PI-PLC X domain-containing protein 1 [Herpailurus yagouaroundi]|uniref:PI-PLC X domain-containing protein 1 n=1 Tax=Herpailurus yagouaroundi TaxID=1608482 RepID=UPI001AD6F7CD|nr:PI-PLC X domain-containing protein 1 [Puma yagouaroundi]
MARPEHFRKCLTSLLGEGASPESPLASLRRGRTEWPLMGGQVSASGNFQGCGTNADWMSALCPLLRDVPLHHLSIPPFSLVQDTLTEISEWLESHPQEVVILACRDFDGLTDNLHEYLVACINNIFGDMLCPRGEVPTLNQLWTRGQQVILSYEEASVVSRHRELWPGIPYWWGDQVKPQELIHYLEHMKRCGRPGGLFVAGINLTENLTYILAHLSESLEKMTLPNLPYLRAWVREQCPGPGMRCTNIIAGDFIGVDTFVSDVIRLNDKLLRC